MPYVIYNQGPVTELIENLLKKGGSSPEKSFKAVKTWVGDHDPWTAMFIDDWRATNQNSPVCIMGGKTYTVIYQDGGVETDKVVNKLAIPTPPLSEERMIEDAIIEGKIKRIYKYLEGIEEKKAVGTEVDAATIEGYLEEIIDKPPENTYKDALRGEINCGDITLFGIN